MAPRRRCPTCGSRQWHKEPSSGLIACSEGHVLQNYRSENTELTEMGPHAMKKRTLKSTKKKKELESNADPKLYHGARGRYHYFLCLQLLLRQQAAALITLWALPPEFEVICRDVWALHLDLLRGPVPAEPFNYAQQDKLNEESNGRNEAVSKADTNVHSISSVENPSKKGSNQSDRSESSDSSSDSDTNEHEMEQLMKENSELSSSEEDNVVVPDSPNSAAKLNSKKKGARSHHIYESPPSTIAVLIVACWIMRIPCLYRDFNKVIESYKLPYLDPVRLLPQSMVQHLTKHSKQALSPHHAPSTTVMHKLASRLAKRLYSTYAVCIPEANAPSILWRVVRAMGGTPTLYGLTKRMAGALSLPLTLHSSLGPGLQKKRKYDPNSHHLDNVPVEESLMASCIIVLKMVYGLDGVERLPRDAGDPACAMPRYDAFLRLLGEMNAEDAKEKENVFGSSNAMRLEDLSEEMLDEYLGFCERALGGAEKHGVLDEYFPTGDVRGTGVAETREREALPGTLTTRKGVRPGEEYRLWNAGDVRGTTTEEYGRVLLRGAAWVGVGTEQLGRVVEKYERRIARGMT